MPKKNDRKQVEETLRKFISAFEQFDLESFLALFIHDEDVTIFFPISGMPMRYQGWSSIRQAWQEIFRHEKTASGDGVFQLHISDLEIQMYENIAIATFLVNNSPPERVHRRTIVMLRKNGHWLIVHLHGSNFDTPAS